MVFAQIRKNTHLAVVDLASPTAPLPGHTDRMRPGFPEAALVDQQAAVAVPTQPPIRLLRDLIDNRPVIPFGVRQHMIQLLLVGFRHPFLHSLHIFLVRIRLHESAQVMTDGL